MDITITIPDTQVNNIVDGIMANFPEASSGCALACIGWQYERQNFVFVDGEDNKTHNVDTKMLHKAFGLMFTDKWPKGCVKLPMTDDPEVWNDWLCQADATDFDAFVQLAIFGEVIYG